MNRKILAGAMALALPLSIVGVNAAGATAKTTIPAPTITGFSFSNQSPTATGETGNQIAPYQTATLTINGTNLSTNFTTTAKAAAAISGSIAGSGLYALTGAAITVKSVTTLNTGQIVASVEGPTGDSVLYTTTGYHPGTFTLKLMKSATVSYATLAGSTGDVVSNCGSTLPAAATAGSTYGTDAAGNLDVGSGATGSQAGLDYFDVSINAVLATGNLCSDDIGSAATSVAGSTPQYNSNYPVSFTSGGATSGQYNLDNVAFTFPYTASRTLSVFGETEVFQLGGNFKTGTTSLACGRNGAPEPSGVTIQSCTVTSAGLVTLSATGTTSYTPNSTITSPTFSISGIQKASGSDPVTLSPVSTTSEIGLALTTSVTPSCVYSASKKTYTAGTGSICTGIIFAPRALNAGYAVASTN